MTRLICALTVALTSVLPARAQAQDTVDIGVLRNEEITVVQKLLYPKTGRAAFGAQLGMMPFDGYLFTPNLQLSFTKHTSETFAWSFVAGGGYGLKNGTYRELEDPPFAVAPEAFRYLGSALFGAEWSPIYAKMNLNGARVVHFDVYLAGRLGATLEQSVLPGGGLGYGPTASPAVGGRFFLGDGTYVTVELRDDLLFERRDHTGDFAFKQNANVLVGLSFLTGQGT